MNVEVLVGLAIGVVVVLLWGFQFVQLMLLEDADFPGRHDKILWVVTFLVLFFIAPFLFMAWKSALKHIRQSQRREP
jgi:hypothetical protein